MRDYGAVSPQFWIGETGRALRGDPLAQVVALYLVTAPTANMIGLYYLPVATLGHEVGCPFEGASKALRRLSGLGFAFYDEDSETVWVPEMARYQIGESMKPGDKRVAGVERELRQQKKSGFFRHFLARYREVYHLRVDASEGSSAKPLGSPFEGPWEPLRSQDQDQDQDQDHEQKKSISAELLAGKTEGRIEREVDDGDCPPLKLDPLPTTSESPVVAVIPCVGSGPKEAAITESMCSEWAAAYPGVDIRREVLRAAQWAKDNPTRRKTSRGVRPFVSRWLSRAQDSAAGHVNGPGRAPVKTCTAPAEGGRTVTRRIEL